MPSRLLAAGLLVASALLAWTAVSSTLVARSLQAAIAASMVYVGFLAWRGWQTLHSAFADAGSGSGIATGLAIDLPHVTVIVPARDEAAVIGALIGDLRAQAYAADGQPRFDILVVDDGSRDGSGELLRAMAASAGPTLQVVRREPGEGLRTKGAVLAFAMPAVRGEVLAVLDADARVAPDFVERAMRAWDRDSSAAALQVQRREYNAGADWLAAAQQEEQLMDLASQCGRWATDGTAELRGNGMFIRRDILERIGGWSPESLTEDLELSTRLVRAGEHVTLAPEATVGEEAVESPAALWRQRLRWAEGSLRRLLEHGPALMTGKLPLGRKLDFLAFVAEFVIPPLFIASLVAGLVTALLPRGADWTVPASLFAGYGIGTFLLALAGLAADGARGLALLGRAARGSLFLSHWLLVVPAALLLIAVGPRTMAFAKTPRSGPTPDR